MSVSLIILQILYCLFLISSFLNACFRISTYSSVPSIIQVVFYVPIVYFLFKRKKIAYNLVTGFEVARLIYTIVAVTAFFPGYFQFAYFNYNLAALKVIVQIVIRPIILLILVRKSKPVLIQ